MLGYYQVVFKFYFLYLQDLNAVALSEKKERVRIVDSFFSEW